jgi:hypothetical protein
MLARLLLPQVQIKANLKSQKVLVLARSHATKAADDNYNVASSAPATTVTVSRANQATLSVASPAAGTYGQFYTMTSSGGNGTGAVSFNVSLLNRLLDCYCLRAQQITASFRSQMGSGSCSITATKLLTITIMYLFRSI